MASGWLSRLPPCRGWGDFCRWASALHDEYTLVRRLAVEGKGTGSVTFEDQLSAAVEASPPGKSSGAVVARLIEVMPHEGKLTVADEPDDSEMDEGE